MIGFTLLVYRIAHRVAHWLHLQHGDVETWWDEEDRLLVGFRCRTCGEISSIKVIDHRLPLV